MSAGLKFLQQATRAALIDQTGSLPANRLDIW